MTGKCMISGTESSIFRLNIMLTSMCILSVRKSKLAVSSSILQVPISCGEQELIDPHTCSQCSLWTGSQAWCPAPSPQNSTDFSWFGLVGAEASAEIQGQLWHSWGAPAPATPRAAVNQGISCFLPLSSRPGARGSRFHSGWVMKFDPLGSQLHPETADNSSCGTSQFCCFSPAVEGLFHSPIAGFFLSFPQQLKVGFENLCFKVQVIPGAPALSLIPRIRLAFEGVLSC